MTKLYKLIQAATLSFFLFLFAQHVGAQNCWQALGGNPGSNGYYQGVTAITTYNGNIIVSGQFDSICGVPASNIAQWNGTTWQPLGQGIKVNAATFNSSTGAVWSLAVYNGDLYACGTFDTAGGQPAASIARWDGTSWYTVGGGIRYYSFLNGNNSQYTSINKLIVYNNYLYVLGSFDTVGNVQAFDIAKWDGSNWSAVGGGLTSAAGSPLASSAVCASVINGKLYVAGGFELAGGLSAINIAAWDGNTWTALGAGVGNDTIGKGGVASIAEYQGDIVAAVNTNDPNNYEPVFYISKYDGTNWSSVAGGPGTGINYSGYALTLLPFDNKLVAAGVFSTIGNDTNALGIAQWDGTTWTNLTNGTDSAEYNVLANCNGYLYVGGFFVAINGVNASSIAEYTCATSAVNEVKAGASVNLYPNPTNGIITISADNLTDKATIQIYNLLGQIVLQSKLNSENTEINLTGQASGTYLYRISGQNGEPMSAGTFVVQ